MTLKTRIQLFPKLFKRGHVWTRSVVISPEDADQHSIQVLKEV